MTEVRTHDRLLWLVLALSAVITFATILVAVVGLPSILSTSDATHAVNQSNAIAACRSQYRSLIDDASVELADANAAQSDLIIAGLAASVGHDSSGLADLVVKVPQARARSAAAREAVRDANTQYQAAVKLSRTDPDRFLAQCRRLPE